MIRYAEQSDIPALKALWQQAFEDEADFVERFFEKRVSNQFQNVILLEEQGTLISMLYALPCILVHGANKAVRYKAVNLVGVATDSSQRHKGYMTRLLEAAFSMLAERGVEAIVLKPSNPQFYEQYGFRICNTLYQFSLPEAQFQVPDVPQEKLPAFLCQCAQNYPTASYQILRSEADWAFQLEDGVCVCLWKDGYAICERAEEGYTAYEALPIEKAIPCGYTMYKKIGQCPELPEDIGRENLIFEWY